MENITIIREEVGKDKAVTLKDLCKDNIVIIATGPLTSNSLSEEILELTGENDLHFYDAAAPIVAKDSINMNIAFYGNRYEQERPKEQDIEEWKAEFEEERKHQKIVKKHLI